MSRWHSGSENFRPMRRFVAKRVFSGLTTACRFAEMPTNRSPFSANATTDGVVLAPNAMESAHVGQPFTARCDLPSEFSIIFGVFPSITATAELVVPRCCQSTQTPVARDRSSVIMNVPKSMPMTWPLTFSSPPVEAYRARNDVVGDRIFENREMGDDRGSYEKSVKAGS